jgi:Uma2 family endonuclease
MFLPEQLSGLTKTQLSGIPRLCPDFIIELLSVSDSHSPGPEKMAGWIANGAQLAWLIEPYERKVFIHRPGIEVSIFSGRYLTEAVR